jgi:hypothetical protein
MPVYCFFCSSNFFESLFVLLTARNAMTRVISISTIATIRNISSVEKPCVFVFILPTVVVRFPRFVFMVETVPFVAVTIPVRVPRSVFIVAMPLPFVVTCVFIPASVVLT